MNGPVPPAGERQRPSPAAPHRPTAPGAPHHSQRPRDPYATPGPNNPYAPSPPSPGSARRADPDNSHATISLVLAATNILFPLTWLPGIVFGVLGMIAARRSPTHKGLWLAVLGVVVNICVGIGFVLLMLYVRDLTVTFLNDIKDLFV